jgi:hypothetical protein
MLVRKEGLIIMVEEGFLSLNHMQPVPVDEVVITMPLVLVADLHRTHHMLPVPVVVVITVQVQVQVQVLEVGVTMLQQTQQTMLVVVVEDPLMSLTRRFVASLRFLLGHNIVVVTQEIFLLNDQHHIVAIMEEEVILLLRNINNLTLVLVMRVMQGVPLVADHAKFILFFLNQLKVIPVFN